MIYFFYGDEEFNISAEIKKLKSQLDKNFIEMSYKEFDNPKFPELIAAISTQPMMFGKMLIVIDCIKYFGAKSDDSFDDKQIKQLTETLDNCNENLDVVLKACIDPESKKKIDKRKKIFKLLSKYNQKEFLQIPSYKTTELESWIKNQAQTKKIKITNDAVSQLLLQVGANLRLLDTELEKLKVFAGNNAVSIEMVKEICVNNEDVFTFLDYLILGQKAKALEEYQKLLMVKHPLSLILLVHAVLQNKIHIKAYSNKYSSEEIAQILNMHPYRVKNEINKFRNASLRNLVKLKQNLTKAEYKIKSGQSNIDMGREVEYALLQ